MDSYGSIDSKPDWFGAEPTGETILNEIVDSTKWGLVFAAIFLVVFLAASVLFASLFIREKTKYDNLKAHGQSFYAINLGWQKVGCGRSCTYRVFIIYGANVRGSFTTSNSSFTQDRFIHIYYDRANPHRFVTVNSDVYYAIVPAVVLFLASILFLLLLRARVRFRSRAVAVAANPRWQAPAIIESRQYGGRGGPVFSLRSADGAKRLLVQLPRRCGKLMQNLVGSSIMVLGELQPGGVIFLKLPDGSFVAPVNRAAGANRFVTRRLNGRLTQSDTDEAGPIS